MTHNSRDKGGHEAYHLEASRNISFSLFTQGTVFLVRNAYGLRAIRDDTTCGQQGIGGANKVPLLDKGASAVLGIFMAD